jgi:hypothetical protein
MVADIRRFNPTKPIVLTLVIDEFQAVNRLADLEEGQRSPASKVKSPIRILARLMQFLHHPEAAILPILVGLKRRDALEDSENNSTMRKLVHIQLPPLSFEHTMNMILECQSPTLLRLRAVQETLFKYSAVPGVIAGVLDNLAHIMGKSPQAKPSLQSLSDAWPTALRMSLQDFESRSTDFIRHIGSRVIPLALTREHVTHKDIAELEEVCRAFWSERCGAEGPLIIRMPAIYLFWPSKDFIPDSDKTLAWNALKKATELLETPTTADWQQLEHIIACNMGIVFNAFLCLPAPKQCVEVQRLFPGAFISAGLRNYNVHLKPLVVFQSASPLLHIDDEESKPKSYAIPPRIVERNGVGVSHAFGGKFLHLCAPNQEAIDIFTVIEIDHPRIADQRVALLVGIQSKLLALGGLTPATYQTCAEYMRVLVRKYTDTLRTEFPHCNKVGFLLGIVNPIKACSEQVKEFINHQSRVDEFEFYFAVGRAEVRQYFGPLADHPVLEPRLFINQATLDSNRLALFLPSDWCYRNELAKLILEHRESQTALDSNIQDWNELTARAQKAENERVRVHNQTVQEAVDSLKLAIATLNSPLRALDTLSAALDSLGAALDLLAPAVKSLRPVIDSQRHAIDFVKKVLTRKAIVNLESSLAKVRPATAQIENALNAPEPASMFRTTYTKVKHEFAPVEAALTSLKKAIVLASTLPSLSSKLASRAKKSAHQPTLSLLNSTLTCLEPVILALESLRSLKQASDSLKHNPGEFITANRLGAPSKTDADVLFY